MDERVLELSSKEYLSAETSTKLDEFKSQSEEDDNQTKPRITRDVDPAKKFVSGFVDKLETVKKHDSEEDYDEEPKYINSESLSGRGTSDRYVVRVYSSKYNNDDFDGDDMEEKDERSSLVGDSRSEVQNNKGGELEDVKSVDDNEKEAQMETEQTKGTHSKERNKTELSREITAEKENLDTSEGSSENKTLGKLDRRLPTKDGKKDHEYTKSNLQEKSKKIPESENVDKEGQREKSDEAKDQRNAGILNAVKDKRNANGQIQTDNEIADDTHSTKSFGSLGMDPTEDISERKTPNKLMSISLTVSKGKQNCTTRISDAEKAEFDDREKQNENKKMKGLNLRLSNLLKWHNKIAAAEKMGKAPELWGSGFHFDLQQYPNGHEMATRIRREAATVGKSSNKLMNKNPVASQGKQNLSTTKSEEENEDFDERDDQNERKNIKGLNLRPSNVLKTVSKPGKQISRTDLEGVRVLSNKLSRGEKQGMAKRPNLLDDDDDEDDSIPSKMSGSGSRLHSRKYTNDHKKTGRSSRESATVGKSSNKLMDKNPIASKGKQILSMTKSEEEKEDFDESDDQNSSKNNKDLNQGLPNMQKFKVATTGKPGKQISGTDSQGVRGLSKKLTGDKQGMVKLSNSLDDEDDEDDSKSSTQSGGVSRLNTQKYGNDHKTASRIRRAAATVGKSSNKLMNKNQILSNGNQILPTMNSVEEKEDFDESDDQKSSSNNKGLNQRLPNMQKSNVATTVKPGKQISVTDSQGVRGPSKKLSGDKQAMVKLPNSLDDEDDEDDSTSTSQSGGVSRLNTQKYANDHKMASRIRRAAANVGKSSNKLMNKNPIASKGKQILSMMKCEEEKDSDESDDLDESNNNNDLNQRLSNMKKSKVATKSKPGKQISGNDSEAVRALFKKLRGGAKQGMSKLRILLNYEDDDDESNSSTQSSSGSRLNSQEYANHHKIASRIQRAATNVGKSSNKLMNKNPIASKGKQNLSMMKSEEEKDFDESDDLDESNNNNDLNQRLPNMQKSNVATTGKPGKQISGTDSQGVRGLSKKLSGDKQAMVNLSNSLDDEDDEDDSTSTTQSSSGSRLNSQEYANDHKMASRIRRAAANFEKSSNKLMNKNPIASKGKQILSMTKSEEEKDFDESDDLDESNNNKGLNQRLPNMQKSNVATTGKPGKQISGTDSQGVRGLSKKLSGDKQAMVNLSNSLDDEDDEDDSTSTTQSSSGSRLNSQEYANDHKMASRIRRAAATVGKSSNKLMNKNPIASKGKQNLSMMKSEEEKDFDESDDLDESNNNKGLNQRLPNMQKSNVATTDKPGKQISGTDSQGVRGLSKKLSGDKQAMVNLSNSLDDEDDEDDSTSTTQSSSGSRLNSQEYANDHKMASRIRRAAANFEKSSNKLMNKNPIASKGKQILSMTKSEEEKDFDESDDLDESNNNKGLNQRLPNMQKSNVATTGKPGKQISGTNSQGVRGLSKKLTGDKQAMVKLPNSLDNEDDEDDSTSTTQSSSGSHLNSQQYANDHKMASRIRRAAATVGKSSNKLMNKNPIASKGKQILSMTKSEEEKDFDESDDLDESNNNKGLNQRLPNMQKSNVATTGKPGKQISGTNSQGVRGLSKKLSGDKQSMVKLPNSLDDEDDEDDSKSSTQSSSGSRLNSQQYANDHKMASGIRRAAATVGKSSNKLMNKNPIASKGKQILSMTKSEEEKDFDESDDLDESNNNKGLNQRLPNMQKSNVATTGKPGKQISGTDSQGVRGLSKKPSGDKQAMVKLSNSLDEEDDEDDSTSTTQSSSGSRLNSQEYANDHKMASRIRRAAATVGKSSNKLMNKNPIASKGKQILSMTKSEEEKDFDESDDLDESNNNKGLNQRLPNMQKSNVATTGKPGKQISGTNSQGVRGLSKKPSGDKQAMVKLSNSLDEEDDEDDSTSTTQSSSGSRLNSQQYANDHKMASGIRRAPATVGKSSNKLMNKNPIASKGKQILSMTKSEEEKDFDESDDLDESNNNKGLNQRLPNMQKSNVATTGKPGKQISGTNSQGVRGLSKKPSGDKQAMVKLSNSLDEEDDEDDSTSTTQSSSGSRLNSQEYANDHKMASRIRRAAATVGKSSNKLMNKNPIASKGKQILSLMKSEEEKDFDESDDMDESNNNKGLNQRLPNMQKSNVATRGKPAKQISGTNSQGVRGLSKKPSGDKQSMVNLPNSLDDEDDEDDSTSTTQSSSGSRLNSQEYANDHKMASRIRRAAATVGKSSNKLMNKNPIASKGKQILSMTKSEEEKDFDESDDLDESNNNNGLNQRLPNMQKSNVATTGKPGKQISGTDSQGVRGLSKKLSGDKQAMVKLSNSLDEEDDEDDSTSTTQSSSGSRLNSQQYANDHKMASGIRRAPATVGKSSNKLMNKNPIASKGKQILSMTKSEEEKDFDESDDLDESNNNKGLNQRLPNMQKSNVATTGKPGKQISGTDSQGVRGLSKKLSGDKQAMVKLSIPRRRRR
ncbi:unnamed protein product [Acanthosepion pharaonis]|uniref:Uncharacterized protein n=1 Tax=Acanthosepion pharaonis TaxID=158019 RepID=A0A812CT56_ACAPH|nr:unnamed protein product [Sepia pharaonis]